MTVHEDGFVIEKLSPAQKQAARFLARSHSEAVQVTIFGEARVCDLVALRSSMSTSIKPTVSHFLIAALTKALERHPQLNAHFEDNQLKLFDDVHIGLAVETASGNLMVPVLKNLRGKNLEQISELAISLTEKARAEALDLSDIRGAGMTLSNVGRNPTTQYVTPVIPLPQVAILATTAIRQMPIVADGEITPAHILPLSLSFDHRAINGASAVAFLDTLAEVLATPQTLI